MKFKKWERSFLYYLFCLLRFHARMEFKNMMIDVVPQGARNTRVCKQIIKILFTKERTTPRNQAKI